MKYLLCFFKFSTPNLPKHLFHQSLLICNIQIVQAQTLIVRRVRIQPVNNFTRALEHDRVLRPYLMQRVLPTHRAIGKMQNLVIFFRGAKLEPVDDELALPYQTFALEEVQDAQFFARAEVLGNFRLAVFVNLRRDAILVQDV